ncbi:hypothetical protein [Rathayibacter tanaceti]|uniref:Uncharacterized protein n=2 Tax=Rathayibacter tanaceti TaxID=1671680 RepID=A0A166H704_9MICO|nr:hypothetical protein [Rathayibacter tanaceti]KZX20061.1 hypothetical protein ACH61_02833 [Rathayibacter tanaceti]QHC56477.1 hypothetical protein GSU10_13130 [Rathayibacter tanaceti]TCO36683.1 hypothetical protein EV639_10686 [Rathayibacter tanaceti]
MPNETERRERESAPQPRTGLEEALAAPVDPETDPGPGERSGLSSRIAQELLEDGFGLDSAGDPPPARPVEVDDPARSVGDDPDDPIHGSMSGEFERR